MIFDNAPSDASVHISPNVDIQPLKAFGSESTSGDLLEWRVTLSDKIPTSTMYSDPLWVNQKRAGTSELFTASPSRNREKPCSSS